MITREDVADLQPGDVVELHQFGWREGVTLRGPLHESSPGTLWLADVQIRHHDGDVYAWSIQGASTLTVVSRAPRPLYVNHPRTKPVPGDVVRDADSDSPVVWIHDGFPNHDAPWNRPGAKLCSERRELPSRLRLLVDGETGMTVPS